MASDPARSLLRKLAELDEQDPTASLLAKLAAVDTQDEEEEPERRSSLVRQAVAGAAEIPLAAARGVASIPGVRDIPVGGGMTFGESAREAQQIMREWAGDPESIPQYVARFGGTLVGGGSVYKAAGSLLGRVASRAAPLVAGPVGRVLAKIANPTTTRAAVVRDIAAGAPIDVAIAAPDREQSIAGLVASFESMSDNELVQAFANDPVARSAIEVLLNSAATIGLSSILHARLRRAKAKAAEIPPAGELEQGRPRDPGQGPTPGFDVERLEPDIVGDLERFEQEARRRVGVRGPIQGPKPDFDVERIEPDIVGDLERFEQEARRRVGVRGPVQGATPDVDVERLETDIVGDLERPTTQVDAGPADAATGPPAGQPQPARSGIPRLPQELAGAKPRFGFRNRNVSLNFKNDVDRALYIVAQTRPSKRDADFMAWLRNVLPGMSDDEIRSLGQQVRARVKRIVEDAPNATRVDVPSTGLFRRGGPAHPGFATAGVVRGITRAGVGAVAGSVAGSVTAENPEDRLGRAILGAVGGATIVVGASAGRAYARQLIQPDGAARRSLLRELHPDGVLDRVTADLDRQRRQLQSAEVRRVRNITADLRRALHAEFGTNRWTELPAHVRTAVRQAMQQDPADTVDMVRRGELPQSVADAIVAARNHVDALSKQFVQEGLVQGPLAQKFDDNLGVYLHRSYRIFDDPKRWRKFLRESDEGRAIYNRFQSWLRAEYPDMTEGALNALSNHLLNKADSPFAFMAALPASRRRNLSVLKRRGDVPEEIRALWGEWEDPLVNYSRSVFKMTALLENTRFLRQLREAGEGRLFFTGSIVRRRDAKTGAVRTVVEGEGPPSPVGYKQISAEGNLALIPLDGMWAREEIVDALFAATRQTEHAAWLRALLIGNAVAKYSKTVLSIQTGVRNVISSFLMLTAQGHTFREGTWDKVREGFATAWGVGVLARGHGTVTTPFAKAISGGKGMSRREYYEALQRLGVVDESVRASELEAYMRDVFGMVGAGGPPRDLDLNGKLANAWRRSGEIARRGAEIATDVYRAGDDFAKIVAFETEFQDYLKALGNADEAQRVAARIVRDVLPTYSMVPEFIRELRQFPLVGTFVSFPYEVFRTGYGTLRQIDTELRSDNAAIRKIGARRLAGVLGTISGIVALGAGSAMLSGIDKEERNAIRRQLPWWATNSQVVWLGRSGEPGNPKYHYIDLSYTDPWSYLQKPLIAMLRGEDWQTTLREVAIEALAPWLGEELFFQAIRESATDVLGDGGAVREPEDTFLQQFRQVAGRVIESIEPGTVTSAAKIITGKRGVSLGRLIAGRPPTGDANRLAELAAVLTGFRVTTVDPQLNLSFAARDYTSRIQNARRIFTRGLDAEGNPRTFTVRGLKARAQRSLNAEQRIVEEYHGLLRDLIGAMGMDPTIAYQTMRDANVSRKEILRILSGNAFYNSSFEDEADDEE